MPTLSAFLSLHTAYTQHFSFAYCAMRLSLIIMFVFRSVFIYYRRACHMEHVYSDCTRAAAGEGEGRGGCATGWFMKRPEKRNAVANCLLLAYTRPILAPKTHTHTRKKPAPKYATSFGELQTGFIKYQRTFQSKSIWTLIAQLQGMTWHPGCDSQFE